MTQAVSRRPDTVEVQDRLQTNSSDIYSEQSDIGTDFPLSTSVFLRQYHSISVPY